MVDVGDKFAIPGGTSLASIQILRDFIVDELHWDEHGGPLAHDYPLIENHVVDSLGLLTLVCFLEERFGIEVLDEELLPENFRTLDAIAMLIERKRSGSLRRTVWTSDGDGMIPRP